MNTPKNVPPITRISWAWVFMCACLTGCVGIGGGGGAGDGEHEATADSDDVPQELITMEDSSAVVDALNKGIDLDFQLLRTPFYCYYNFGTDGKPLTDFSTPHVSVDYVGDSFTMTGMLGDHTGSIDDNEKSDRVEFTFDGSGTAVSLRIDFDIYGQRLYDQPNNTDLASCYQSGASHERALHQFSMNTPEEGEFSCQVSANGNAPGNAGTIELLSGNRYSFNQAEGTYQISDVFETSVSAIKFDSGKLSGLHGEYTENPNTGVQQFSFVAGATKQTLTCSRQRQPRPFKQFGADIVPLPPASSEPISGDFYLDNGNDSSVGWARFSADGFLQFITSKGISNCRRTPPNGVSPCVSYNYNGGSTITIFRRKGQVEVPIRTGGDGSLLIEGIGRYVPVNAPTANELVGQWRFDSGTPYDANAVSMCILGYCPPSTSSTTLLEFSSNGRFSFGSKSKSTTSTNVPGVNTMTAGQSQSSSAGVYQLEGSSIELQYDSGDIDPPAFLHLLDANRLVLRGRVFRRVK